MRYFDHNATAPLAHEAEAAWIRASREHWYNPSALYRASARARNLVEACRERLAGLVGAGSGEIVFNGGATEGANALFEWMARVSPPESVVWVSAVEHACVLNAARRYFPGRTRILPVNPAGVVEPVAVATALRAEPVALVAVMAANNETGVLQPWREILRVCREHGAPLACDIAQWLGRLPAEELGACDFLIGCGHKFGGPKGVGFLKLPDTAHSFEGLAGGAQEGGRRGGTENYPSIAALLAALETAHEELDAEAELQAQHRDTFEALLAREIPQVRFLGEGADRLPNTSLVLLPAHDQNRWVAKLDRLGFAVSTGAACSTGRDGPSHVLTAMGCDPLDARRTVRISGGRETSRDDWLALADAFAEVWRDLERSSGDLAAISA